MCFRVLFYFLELRIGFSWGAVDHSCKQQICTFLTKMLYLCLCSCSFLDMELETVFKKTKLISRFHHRKNQDLNLMERSVVIQLSRDFPHKVQQRKSMAARSANGKRDHRANHLIGQYVFSASKQYAML